MEPSGLVASIENVVRDHPVELVVLFGSYAHGTQAAESDLDIAVAFAGELDRAERFDARIELITDLSIELDRNDIDVADFDSIRPAVGLSALRDGIVCYGDQSVARDLEREFEQAVEPPQSRAEQREQFDEIIDALEG